MRLTCRENTRLCRTKYISESNLKTNKVPILEVQMLRFYHSLNNFLRHPTTRKQYCTTPHPTLQSHRLHCTTFHTLHCTTFRYTSRHEITTTLTTTFVYTLLYCTKLHYIPGPVTALENCLPLDHLLPQVKKLRHATLHYTTITYSIPQLRPLHDISSNRTNLHKTKLHSITFHVSF